MRTTASKGKGRNGNSNSWKKRPKDGTQKVATLPSSNEPCSFEDQVQKEVEALQSSTKVLETALVTLRQKRKELQEMIGPCQDMIKTQEPVIVPSRKLNHGAMTASSNSPTQEAGQAPAVPTRTPLTLKASAWSGSSSDPYYATTAGAWSGPFGEAGYDGGYARQYARDEAYYATQCNSSPPPPIEGLSKISAGSAHCFGELFEQINVANLPSNSGFTEYSVEVKLRSLDENVRLAVARLHSTLSEQLESESVVSLDRSQDGSRLLLVYQHVTENSCWEHIHRGTCPRQSRCRWEHPRPAAFMLSIAWPGMEVSESASEAFPMIPMPGVEPWILYPNMMPCPPTGPIVPDQQFTIPDVSVEALVAAVPEHYED